MTHVPTIVKTAAAAILVALAIVGWLALAMPPANAHPTSSSTPTRITEDDPRWDCRTMGNRLCGPQLDLRGWTPVPRRLVGEHVDLVYRNRSRRVGPHTLQRDVNGTTYFRWPGTGPRVLGTS
jgi:hypothetical protein